MSAAPATSKVAQVARLTGSWDHLAGKVANAARTEGIDRQAAADILGLDVNSVSALVSKGKIRRVGRGRFDEASVREYGATRDPAARARGLKAHGRVDVVRPSGLLDDGAPDVILDGRTGDPVDQERRRGKVYRRKACDVCGETKTVASFERGAGVHGFRDTCRRCRASGDVRVPELEAERDELRDQLAQAAEKIADLRRALDDADRRLEAADRALATGGSIDETAKRAVRALYKHADRSEEYDAMGAYEIAFELFTGEPIEGAS